MGIEEGKKTQGGPNEHAQTQTHREGRRDTREPNKQRTKLGIEETQNQLTLNY